MQYICALIAVEDIAESKKFYEMILNQKVKYDFGQNIQFEGGFTIHLRSHFKSLLGSELSDDETGSRNIELYFEDNDLTSIEKRLEKYEVRFIHRIQEQSWRQKVIRIYDPDGYIIEIGEPMEAVVLRLHNEGLDTGAICEATGLSDIFINQALKI
jgi:catechol 2,3-dioxygenase-like lactoylglutathione lyase family enzyme